MSAWVYLSIAIVLEVIGTSFLKLSEGFTKLTPSLLVIVCYAGAFFLLALSLKKLEVGAAYALWSGIGTALIATIGILYFNESINLLKIISIGLIILGVIGLNMAGMKH